MGRYDNYHLTVWFDPNHPDVSDLPTLIDELRAVTAIPGITSWCFPSDIERGQGSGLRGCLTRHPYSGQPHICHVPAGGRAHLTVPFHAINVYEAQFKAGAWPNLSAAFLGSDLSFRGKQDPTKAYPGAIPADLLEDGTGTDKDGATIPVPAQQAAVLQRGREGLLASGKVRDISALRFYQLAGAGVLLRRPGIILQMDGGTGKTVTSLAAALAVGAKRILVVCPAAVRSPVTGWPADARRFFTAACKILYPNKSKQRIREGGLDTFATGIAVVAVDNLGDYVAEIERWKPDCLIWDELDTYASREIRTSYMSEDGGRVYTERRTERRGILTEAAARNAIARLPQVKWRIGLTATTVGQGELAPLWAMLELVDPDGFGSARVFDERYAAGEPVEDVFGPPHYGPSNEDEMLKRLSYFVIRLPTHVGRKFIKAANVSFYTIPSEELGSDAGYGWAAKEKAAAKGHGDYSEIRSARAASMKRTHAFEILARRLKKRERCVIFTRWIGMAETWAEKARERWPDAWVGTATAASSQLDEYAQRAALWEKWETTPSTGDVIFVNIGVGGRGTNALKESHWMFVAELTNNPGVYQQLIARAERPKEILLGVTTDIDIPIAEGTADDDTLSKLVTSSAFSSRFTGSEQASVITDAVNRLAHTEARELTKDEQLTLAEKAVKWAGGAGTSEEEVVYFDDEEVPF